MTCRTENEVRYIFAYGAVAVVYNRAQVGIPLDGLNSLHGQLLGLSHMFKKDIYGCSRIICAK
jgi:hypothetical protein